MTIDGVVIVLYSSAAAPSFSPFLHKVFMIKQTPRIHLWLGGAQAFQLSDRIRVLNAWREEQTEGSARRGRGLRTA